MNREKRLEIVTEILGQFEELLEYHNITIPSEEREGREEEARIYGIEYYNLEDKIMQIIDNGVKK